MTRRLTRLALLAVAIAALPPAARASEQAIAGTAGESAPIPAAAPDADTVPSADAAAAEEAAPDDEDVAEESDEAGATDEIAEMQAAEAEAMENSGPLHLERALRLLGGANPWRSRMHGSLGLDASEWPALLEEAAPNIVQAPIGELPFPVDSVAAKYDIPVAWNEAVAEYIAFFQGPGRRYYERWLERSGRYIPLFREILRSHGVPEDLVYLSMIESGFSMSARSWASAVGPWQFIDATGKMYGLRNDFWVDERQDPEKATHAAARFLKWLHNIWGDWYLAWAGYNAGPGRVKKAIDANGTQDFWALAQSKGAFRQETQHYVPKLIAAALIAKHPEHFGFGSVRPMAPLEWETVEIPDATDLNVIARCAGVTVEAVKDLNPELRRWATPPVPKGSAPYKLRLPKGSSERFAEAFAQVAPSERFTFRSYKVRRGDTLGHIAMAFDTSVEAVLRANNMRNVRALRIGQELIIPVPPGVQPHFVQARSSGTRVASSQGPSRGGTHHVLGQGETLGHVALRYGCTVEQLKRWNGIRDVRKVRAGQKLRVR